MARLLRLFFPLALLVLVSSAFGQGGAAGYGSGGGGGGFGGGAGGGAMGSGSDYSNDALAEGLMSKPEDKEKVLWTSKSAVLTPGDKVEFKFKLAAGEVLMASATSDAFDAALSITDDKGVLLSKNDDREEGDQSPFVIYQAKSAGTFSLNVLSFRSAAGGKFTATFRTILTEDAFLGQKEYAVHEVADRYLRFMLCLRAQKDQIFDLMRNFDGEGARVGSVIRIIGPTGVPRNDFEAIPATGESPIIKANMTGDYYIEYSAASPKPSSVSIAEVPVIKGTAAWSQRIDLDPRQSKIVEFEVKRNMLLWTSVRGLKIAQRLSSPPSQDGYMGGDETSWSTNSSYAWWRPNLNDDDDVIRIFKADGTARLVLRSGQNATQTVVITNSQTLPEWSDSVLLNEKLEIGEAKLYVLSSKQSELMRVKVQAKGFLPRLDIFSWGGLRVNSLSNRKTLSASDDLYFPTQAQWIVRVTCEGFGGSGPFSMQRESLRATPYALSSNLSVKLDGTNFGLYEVNLEAGKRYQLLNDHPELQLNVDLLDEDGQFLKSTGLTFDAVQTRYFVPTKSGRHRLWFRGAPGTHMVKFELHKPPVIGA